MSLILAKLPELQRGPAPPAGLHFPRPCQGPLPGFPFLPPTPSGPKVFLGWPESGFLPGKLWILLSCLTLPEGLLCAGHWAVSAPLTHLALRGPAGRVQLSPACRLAASPAWAEVAAQPGMSSASLCKSLPFSELLQAFDKGGPPFPTCWACREGYR